MEWMEGMGPILNLIFVIVIVLVMMLVARALFHKEPPVKAGREDNSKVSKGN